METTLKQGVYEHLKREYKAALLSMEIAAVDTPEYCDAQRRAAQTSNTCASVIGFKEADQLREDNIDAVNRIIERQEAARGRNGSVSTARTVAGKKSTRYGKGGRDDAI